MRTLSMDAVQAANSGHPGTPMALAPAAYVLFNEVLRYDPARPQWPNRDRFVLSCGHASVLLYSMLHLCEVKQTDGQAGADELAVPLEHLRRFRQLQSRCPGHPEYGHTSGVETTTGPLGQGIGNSVGMAMAACWLGSRYNRPDFPLFDYAVYAFCSDGDLMEGVGGEAASIAGHLKLSNLCWLYDDNHITIEGNTSLSFSEDVARRFAGYGWNVLKVADVNDLAALRAALGAFRETRDRPTLIIVRSVIAWGSPNKQNTHGAHGAPRRGKRGSPPTPSSIRRRPRNCKRSSAGNCRRTGTANCPPFRPTPRGSPAALPPARCSIRSPSACPGCWVARPTWLPRR
ncbi:MAG: hypothetical protein ABSG68_12525 [Thermoguttaceae bacterium]